MNGIDESTDSSTESTPDDATAAEIKSGAADLNPAAAESDQGRSPHIRTPSSVRQVVIALAMLLISSAGLASWLYFGQYRTDRQLGPGAEQAVLTAAAEGAIALLTYAPATLDADFASAESHLTGDFLSYYTDFTRKVVMPAAKEKGVKTSAVVMYEGLMSIRPDSAEVLIFVNQTTVSNANPDGSFSASSVRVGLEKHDHRWLISSFDPVQ